MALPDDFSVFCNDCDCYNIAPDYCLCEECYKKRRLKEIEEIENTSKYWSAAQKEIFTLIKTNVREEKE